MKISSVNTNKKKLWTWQGSLVRSLFITANIVSWVVCSQAQLHHFVVEIAGGGTIPSQTVGAPLFIDVLAKDSNNTTVSSFNGTVTISSNGTLLSGGGTSSAFTNGMLSSYSMSFSNAGNFAITATNSLGPETGTSNTFTVNPIVVRLKIFLEGPFQGSSMNTTLRSSGFIPHSQPYTVSPWNYTGLESTATIPTGTVDWLLIELRSGTSSATRVGMRAAFVTTAGMLIDLSGSSAVAFPDVPVGNYYIVVRHRNHLAVMSASPVSLNANSTQYDFTTGTSQYFGGDAKHLNGVRYAMYAGDYSRDNFIDGSDFVGPDNERFLNGYRFSDINMDGFVDGSDFIAPDNNRFKGTNVPN